MANCGGISLVLCGNGFAGFLQALRCIFQEHRCDVGANWQQAREKGSGDYPDLCTASERGEQGIRKHPAEPREARTPDVT